LFVNLSVRNLVAGYELPNSFSLKKKSCIKRKQCRKYFGKEKNLCGTQERARNPGSNPGGRNMVVWRKKVRAGAAAGRSFLRRPVSERTVSPTYFKSNVPRAVYSVKQKPYWRYADRAERVVNPIKADTSRQPHLILYDSSGTARFALRYNFFDDKMTILSLQRERTQYRKEGKSNLWDAKAETQKSKELQKQLGGMHPAEFLLSEFIYSHRAQIRQSRLCLRVPAYASVNEYRPLIERFFSTKGRKVFGGTIFSLSLRKKRARLLLELP